MNVFDLKPVHQIVGFIDSVDRINLPNMIISEARWQIWKYRCTHRNGKKRNEFPLLHYFKYKIKQNIDILIKSRNFVELKGVLDKVASIL